MKYRLKDRELQQALDKQTNGAFSELLVDVESLEIEVNGKTIALELEPFHEYDPYAWNEWPDVEPPKDARMRIEVKEPDKNLDTPEPRFGKVRERCCAKFDGQYWIRSNGLIVLLHGGETVRFRPWDDPDEEEEETE